MLDPGQQKAEQQLLPFYLWETTAHVLMLGKKNIIPKEAGVALLNELLSYMQQQENGKLQLNPSLGDVHENIEQLLTDTVGKEIAGWVHTGRSRNDQVTCDQKLLIKSLFFTLGKELEQLGNVLSLQAEKTANVLMPGLTHLRVAMPSTVGFWWQSYLVQLVECEQLLHGVYAVINESPLGAGASYGVNWPIDPTMTSDWLGFRKPFSNALAAINSRGIHELYLVSQLSILVTILSRLMEDVIIFSTPQFGYLTLDERYTSGSSIMPQKMNPDIAEKIRGKAAVLMGHWVALNAVVKGTSSGYNRDSAETKPLSIHAFTEMIDTVAIAAEFLAHIAPDKAGLEKALAPALATKLADALVQKYQLPFRLSHQIVGKSLVQAGYDMKGLTPEILMTNAQKVTGKNLRISAAWLRETLLVSNALSLVTYPGSPAPQEVKKTTQLLRKKHEHFGNWLATEEAHFTASKAELMQVAAEYTKKG